MSLGRRASAPLLVLLAVLLGAAVTACAYALPHLTTVRAILALPFLLIAQGYVLSLALFGVSGLRGSERLIAAVVASVSEMILVALGLHVASVAITSHALSVTALAVTVVTAPIALWRLRGRSPGSTGSPRIVLAWVAGLAAAGVIVGGLIVFVSRPEPNPRVVGYTALWGQRSASGTITVGVRSAEQAAHTFRIHAVSAQGASATETVRLAAGSGTTRQIRLPGPPLQRVTVTLYRDRQPGPYREVILKP